MHLNFSNFTKICFAVLCSLSVYHWLSSELLNNSWRPSFMQNNYSFIFQCYSCSVCTFFLPGTQLYLCQTFSECHSYLIKNFCWSFKFSIVIFSSSLSSVNLTLLAIHVSLLLVCAHFENEDVVIYSLMSTCFCSHFWSYYRTNFFLKNILWNQRMYYFL